MQVALILLSTYVSGVDLMKHRIPNRALIAGVMVFTVMSRLVSSPLHLQSALICVAVTPIAMKLKIGAGDSKLLILLALFFLPSRLVTLLDFLGAFSLIALVLIVSTAFLARSLRTNIPLAPAICGAVIWCTR
jgi:Flp pilus assembly protein protease CpaA